MTTPICDHTYFTCGIEIEHCVPWLWVCDGDPDCFDGSDESHELCKYANASCGGNFTAPQGVLTSPSFPDNYPDNLDCVYIISQPVGTVILLIFSSMNIDAFGQRQDYLEIRDGPSNSSNLIEELFGGVIPDPIRSSQNQVWMR